MKMIAGIPVIALLQVISGYILLLIIEFLHCPIQNLSRKYHFQNLIRCQSLKCLYLIQNQKCQCLIRYQNQKFLYRNHSFLSHYQMYQCQSRRCQCQNLKFLNQMYHFH
jgi:hypothetical protein